MFKKRDQQLLAEAYTMIYEARMGGTPGEISHMLARMVGPAIMRMDFNKLFFSKEEGDRRDYGDIRQMVETILQNYFSQAVQKASEYFNSKKKDEIIIFIPAQFIHHNDSTIDFNKSFDLVFYDETSDQVYRLKIPISGMFNVVYDARRYQKDSITNTHAWKQYEAEAQDYEARDRQIYRSLPEIEEINKNLYEIEGDNHDISDEFVDYSIFLKEGNQLFVPLYPKAGYKNSGRYRSNMISKKRSKAPLYGAHPYDTYDDVNGFKQTGKQWSSEF